MSFDVHGIPGSPFVRAVLVTLLEKNADFRFLHVDPRTLRSEEHLQRHPFGRVPAVDHDGFGIYETQAIVRYVDRVLPQPPLTPKDARAAARMDQVMNISDWYLFQGVGNVIAFQRVVAPRVLGLPTDEAACAAAMPRAHAVMAELSLLLGDRAFFTGNALSLAEILLVPHLDMLSMTPEWQELTAGRENLRSLHQRVVSRPSFQETTLDKVGTLDTVS